MNTMFFNLFYKSKITTLLQEALYKNYMILVQQWDFFADVFLVKSVIASMLNS